MFHLSNHPVLEKILLVLGVLLIFSYLGILLAQLAGATTWNYKIGSSNYCSLSSPNQYMLQHN